MTRIILTLIILFSQVAIADEPIQLRVTVEGHEFALWHRPVEASIGTILLLHGRTYSSLPDFDLHVSGENLSFMKGLNEKGFEVYALDARGYGATERDSSGWLTPNIAAKDAIGIIKWINQRHGTKLNLFGWSYGSMISQIVAQREPALINSLLLFGYPFDPERHISKSDAQESTIEAPRLKNSRRHAASDFITPGSISQNAIDAYVNASLKADPVRVDFKHLEQWAELDAKKVSTPTLLMQGEFDPLAKTELQIAFFQNINTSNKWWIFLNGGDHAALLEQPREKMLTLMQTFINSL